MDNFIFDKNYYKKVIFKLENFNKKLTFSYSFGKNG
jgi:hypothetical protein